MKIIIKFLLVFVLSITLLWLNSCGKKWKKPTAVTFKFQLNSNSSSAWIKFTSATITLNKIYFSGNRKQGQNQVDLQQSYTNSITIFPSSSSGNIQFDIPQGTYNQIDVKLEMDEDPTGASLLVNGYYINYSSDTIAIQYTLPLDKVLNMRAKNSSGGNEIVLIEDKPSTANIIMNPTYWFSSVSESSLYWASYSYINGVPTVLIDEDNEVSIYESVTSNVTGGNEVVFQ